jgi:hypothetical protein
LQTQRGGEQGFDGDTHQELLHSQNGVDRNDTRCQFPLETA